jgi:hypothetical protein
LVRLSLGTLFFGLPSPFLGNLRVLCDRWSKGLRFSAQAIYKASTQVIQDLTLETEARTGVVKEPESHNQDGERNETGNNG